MAQTPQQPTPPYGPSTLFEVFAHPDRRRIIGLLGERSPRTLVALSRKLATTSEPAEADEPDERIGMDEPSEAVLQRRRLSLRHVHLPKLDDVELVSYEAGDVAVSLVASGERMDRIETILAAAQE